MSRYCSLSPTFCRFVLTLEWLTGDWLQICRDASDELLNTHNIPIDSKRNDEYRASLVKFLAKY